MPTRIYLPATAETVPISPTPDSAWEDTSTLARAIARTWVNGDVLATVSFTDADSTNKDVLFRQYISYPLIAGQIITGSQALKFQAKCSETNAANNLFLTLGIRIIAADGSTVQKTILAVTRDNTEAATSLTNRQHTATSAATNYTVVAGDRLVIEIGLAGTPTAATHSGSIQLGAQVDATTGQPITDLPENNTSTATNNPWVELTDTLVFDEVNSFDYNYYDGSSIGNRPTTAEWQETSGLARAQKSANSGHIWAQSDGTINKIFAIRLSDGSNQGGWTLSAGGLSDVEDLASATVDDQPYIYLADTGDNSNVRATVVIFRIKEPTITGSDGTLTAGTDYETITCAYDTPATRKDAECILVDPSNGDMYVITKRMYPAQLFKLAHASSYSGTQTLVYQGNITTPAFSVPADNANGGYIVGGDINAERTKIVLKNYRNIYIYDVAVGQTILSALQGTPKIIPAYVGGGRPSSHPNNEPQGEGICFVNNDIYTASEYLSTFGSAIAYPTFKYQYHGFGNGITESIFQEGFNGVTGICLDTYLDKANPSTNRGADTTFILDYNSASDERTALLSFLLTSLPAGIRIVGADLYLYIGTEGSTFFAYKMLKTWTESSTYTSLGSPAFDDIYAASTPDVKHGDYAGLTGLIKLKLPIATVQGWVDNPATNFGYILYSNDIAGGNGFQIRASEYANISDRPKLVLRWAYDKFIPKRKLQPFFNPELAW